MYVHGPHTVYPKVTVVPSVITAPRPPVYGTSTNLPVYAEPAPVALPRINDGGAPSVAYRQPAPRLVTNQIEFYTQPPV